MFSLKLYLCVLRLRPQKGKGEKKKSANEVAEMTREQEFFFFLPPFPTPQSMVFVVVVVVVVVVFFFCCFAPFFAFSSTMEPGPRLKLHVQPDGQTLEMVLSINFLELRAILPSPLNI